MRWACNKRETVGQTYWRNLSIVPCGRSWSCSCSRCLLSRCLHGCCLPQLPVGLQCGEVVDGRKLNQGREDEGKANSNEPIHGCGVRNFGKGVAGANTECCHGQDSGDTCITRRRQKLAMCYSWFHLYKYIYICCFVKWLNPTLWYNEVLFFVFSLLSIYFSFLPRPLSDGEKYYQSPLYMIFNVSGHYYSKHSSKTCHNPAQNKAGIYNTWMDRGYLPWTLLSVLWIVMFHSMKELDEWWWLCVYRGVYACVSVCFWETVICLSVWECLSMSMNNNVEAWLWETIAISLIWTHPRRANTHTHTYTNKYYTIY